MIAGPSGFGNQTARALGTHRAWSDWHTASFTLREPGDLVPLMTDGVRRSGGSVADGFTRRSSTGDPAAQPPAGATLVDGLN